ncbi:MAG: AraC family transcriptional regulator [Bacteroidota bacterium]
MKNREGFKGQRMAVFSKSVIALLEQHPLTQNLYVTDAGFFPNAEYHYVERERGSLQHIIIICVQGKGSIWCDGVKSEIGPKSYYIIPKGTAHKYCADKKDPWTIYWMHFDGSNAASWIDGMHSNAIPLNMHNNALRENTLTMIGEMYAALEDSFSFDSLGYCCVIFGYLLGTLKYAKQYPSRKSLSSKRELVKSAIDFMKANLHRKIALKEISDFLDISLSHFCLLFKQEMSHAPMEYLAMVRVQKACALLSTTDIKIKEIAMEVGFEDPFYFSRMFSKEMGLSPRSYRNLRQKEKV